AFTAAPSRGGPSASTWAGSDPGHGAALTGRRNSLKCSVQGDPKRGIMAQIRYPFHSLEDFLISHELSVDGVLDDGGGALFPVKGKEIQASVFFADITAFSSRTL